MKLKYLITKKEQILEMLKSFYLNPNKDKAKHILKISRYIREHNLEKFLIKPFFEKFLDI